MKAHSHEHCLVLKAQYSMLHPILQYVMIFFLKYTAIQKINNKQIKHKTKNC